MNKIEFGAKQIAIVAVTTAAYSLLALFGSVFQTSAGVSIVYPATAIAVVFTIWFGGWALIGVYLGTLIGGITWAPLLVNMTGGFTTILEGLVPALAFYYIPKLRKDLGDKRSLVVYVISAVILGTFLCSLFGNLNYVIWNYQSLEYTFTAGLWLWWFGDAVAALVLGLPILMFMSPYVMKTSLYHQGFFARRVNK